MRFYLLDKIIKIEKGKYAEGIKCWTMSEEIFNEHFPGYPIVPGVLLTESMAQLTGFLISESYKKEFGTDQEIFALLSIIHKAKFRDFAVPGDQCLIKTELTVLDSDRASGKAKIFVKEKLIAEANLSYTILKEEKSKINQSYIEKLNDYFSIISSGMEIVS